MGNILIVDDDKDIAKLVKTYCELEDLTCDYAENGQVALDKIKSPDNEYELIVLDVMMPIKDGFQTLKEIREFSKVAVIFLSARSEEYDKLFGFGLGADDFLAKPFSPRELVARIKAVLKRNGDRDENELIIHGKISINILAREVTVSDQIISLTPKEYELLLFLSNNYKQVMSREKLMDKVWGYDYYGDARTIDTHVKSLRDRLGECRNYIKTVWGVGYKFEIPKDKKEK